MKKRIIILLIVILIFVVIYCILQKDNSNKITKKPEENTKEIISAIIDQELTEESLKEITEIKNIKSNIIVGEDSFLRNTPSNKIVEKYNLSQYKEERETLALDIEDKFIKNLNYAIISEEENENGELVQTIEVIGFYYELYMADFTTLSIELYEKLGYDSSRIESDEKMNVIFYKAQTKAMQLMEPFISNYENYGEKVTFRVTYVNGKLKDSDEMINIISQIRGMTYSNMDFSKKENQEAQRERIKSYYERGYETGVIKTNNLLDI